VFLTFLYPTLLVYTKRGCLNSRLIVAFRNFANTPKNENIVNGNETLNE
jgi:hypothetical protein